MENCSFYWFLEYNLGVTVRVVEWSMMSMMHWFPVLDNANPIDTIADGLWAPNGNFFQHLSWALPACFKGYLHTLRTRNLLFEKQMLGTDLKRLNLPFSANPPGMLMEAWKVCTQQGTCLFPLYSRTVPLTAGLIQ